METRDWQDRYEEFYKRHKKKEQDAKKHYGTYSNLRDAESKKDESTGNKRPFHTEHTHYEEMFYGHYLPSHFPKTRIIDTYGRE